MGYSVAAEALRRGHEVRLLSGPVCLEAPAGAEVSRFESVEELYALAVEALREADCLVMTAAVGDFRPAERIEGKHKKTGALELSLVPTRDILASLAGDKGRRIFVGFAVEAQNALDNARAKVAAKSLDFLVLNSPESFGAERADFSLVFSDGATRALGTAAKTAVAGVILDEVERLFGE
jgi:phosphopantothenoylcysteine decarboxylase/phosphopantothenate--cysteine ligase